MAVLACPHCGTDLSLARPAHESRTGGILHCAGNHSFDLAKQGYASLLSGHSRTGTADTAAMVTARDDFLAAGHFEPIADLAAEQALAVRTPGSGDTGPEEHVLDIGAGTGYYLARVLDRLDGPAGIALDVSKYACRRAAKAHPRIGAVVADAWQRLPVRSGSASTVLNVFAPRNPSEMHRVLREGGQLVVVTPNSTHLQGLVSRLGLLSVDERKRQRLSEQLGGLFEPLRQQVCEFPLSMGHREVEAVVGMGPSAWHSTPESLHERIEALPEEIQVTASVTVSVHQRRD